MCFLTHSTIIETIESIEILIESIGRNTYHGYQYKMCCESFDRIREDYVITVLGHIGAPSYIPIISMNNYINDLNFIVMVCKNIDNSADIKKIESIPVEKNEVKKCNNCHSKEVNYIASSQIVCYKCGCVVSSESEYQNEEVYINGVSQKQIKYTCRSHAKYWVSRLQGLEKTYIPVKVIAMIKKQIGESSLTIESLRKIMKKLKLGRYYCNIVKIYTIVTGTSAIILSYDEVKCIYQRTTIIFECYEKIKKEGVKNNLYFPFLISKIVEAIMIPDERLEIFNSYIHRQSKVKIKENNSIWSKIIELYPVLTHPLPRSK